MSIKFRQPLDLGSQAITSLAAPTNASDAATKSYVDASAATPVPFAVKTANYTATATDYLLVANSSTGIVFTLPTSAVSNGKTYLIKNIGSADLTVTSAASFDTNYSAISLHSAESRLLVKFSNTWWTATNQTDFNGARLQSLSNPTQATDAATKQYVDLLAPIFKTVNYTLLASDQTVVANSASALTFTLPSAGALTNGQRYQIKNIGVGTLTVQIAAGGSYGIDGTAASSLTLRQFDGRRLWWDATNNQFWSETEQLDFANRTITGVGTPSNGSDAATKSYVDSATRGTGQTLTTQTVNYTATSTDSVILANGSSITVTLPAASSAGAGRTYSIKNINTTGLTIASNGGTIDGATTVAVSQWAARTLVSDGSNWYII